jgi:glycosyltransferase involved in cell wall biosynthesis
MMIDRFFVLSPYARDSLIDAGFEPRKIVVKATPIVDPGAYASNDRSGLLYLGRLSEAKGLAMLVDAWSSAPVGEFGVLRIAGDGPLEPLVRGMAAKRSDVEFLGQLNSDGVDRELRRARCLVVPSISHEGFPRVVSEAFARSTPVIASDVGSLSTIVTRDVGWLFKPNAEELRRTLGTATAVQSVWKGSNARDLFLRHLSFDAVLRLQVETYQEVLTGRLLGVSGRAPSP